MKHVDLKDGMLWVSFRVPNDEFPSVLASVKQLDNRRFDPHMRVWLVQKTAANLEKLERWGFAFSDTLKAALSVPEYRVIPDTELPGMREYQRLGVTWLLDKVSEQRGAILADEMGLGKTVQVLGFLKLSPILRRVLIICPFSAIYVWEYETKRWLDETVEILRTRTPYSFETRRVTVITYDILDSWADTLSPAGFDFIVCDEAHRLSNKKTLRTKAFLDIFSRVSRVIFTTGTPIRNRTRDFYTMLHTVSPLSFPSEWKFLQRYCDPKHNGFGWTFDGATRTDELHSLVQGVMLRREKAQVLKELPPKNRIVVPLELSEAGERVYNESFREWAERLDKESKLAEREHIEKLKQLCYTAKRNAVIHWIDEFLDSSDGKLVIFAWHKAVIADLSFVYKDALVYTGETTDIERKRAVDSFQNDPSRRVFIGNIQAAGEAISLTAASTAVFIEFGWTPGEHRQAEDRIHRFGQEAESINIYYLLAKGTIEDSIFALLQVKWQDITSVLSGAPDDYFSAGTLLDELLAKYTKRREN